MPKNFRRGIYLLPNFFTTVAMLAGAYAIIAAIEGRFYVAPAAILVALILDGMDGWVARLTNTQTDFGVQYDSLSDMVSFGVAPAVLIYEWSLFEFGKIGWLVAFFYMAATALRLARFNTQAANANKAFFQGIPSPAAAILLAGLVCFGVSEDLQYTQLMVVLSFLLPIVAGLLMVSNIRYQSFKQIDFRFRVSFFVILKVLLGFIIIASNPPLFLFLLACIYTISGPAMTLFWLQRHRAARKSAHPSE